MISPQVKCQRQGEDKKPCIVDLFILYRFQIPYVDPWDVDIGKKFGIVPCADANGNICGESDLYRTKNSSKRTQPKQDQHENGSCQKKPHFCGRVDTFQGAYEGHINIFNLWRMGYRGCLSSRRPICSQMGHI